MSYPAESYEHYMVPALFGPWSSYLIQSANVQPGERVLDVACGTGIVARNIARRLGIQGTVIGFDLNLGMLNTARAVAEQEEVAIAWCAGRAERHPFAPGTFDLVMCQFGLMFFEDRHAALTEMYRVLKPGGRIVLSVWQGLDRHPFYQTLDNVSRRYLGKSGVQDVFSLGDSGEVRNLLIDSGFQQIEIEDMSITARFPNAEEFLAWEISVDPAESPTLQDLEAQHAILTALHQEMQAPLRAVMQGDEVVLPFHAHIVRAKP